MEARLILARRYLSLVAPLILAGGCDRPASPVDQPANGSNAVTQDVPLGIELLAGATPMAERVAVLGLLNKRNGIVRDITLKPGQAIRVRDAVIRLRACEASAPWDNDKLTGAFVQLDVEQAAGGWKRVFSGWLYKESPSLNVVEHPIYDVWTKSCAMNWPDAPGLPAMPLAASKSSSAPKSGRATRSPGSPARSDGDAAPSGSPTAPAPAEAPEPLVPVPSASVSNAL